MRIGISQFERQCRVSPDLVPADAKRLAKKARDMFGAQQLKTFGGVKGEATKPETLPPFEKFNLYG